jgi:hypothetical protein
LTKLELGRPRELGELLSLALSLFVRHFSLFFTLALIVVAPYVLVVDGIWGRELAEGLDADPPVAARVTSALLSALVAQPLITAMDARVLLAIEEGRVPSVGEALRAGLQVFLPAAAVVLLYTLGVLAGVLLFIVPGIWIGVRWYFGPQAVVVDGCRGADALRRSDAVVTGQWWATFGRLIVLGFAGLALGLIAGGVLQAIGTAAGSPALFVVGSILGNAAAASFAALAGTLLFFDRRARNAPSEAAA